MIRIFFLPLNFSDMPHTFFLKTKMFIDHVLWQNLDLNCNFTNQLVRGTFKWSFIQKRESRTWCDLALVIPLVWGISKKKKKLGFGKVMSPKWRLTWSFRFIFLCYDIQIYIFNVSFGEPHISIYVSYFLVV